MDGKRLRISEYKNMMRNKRGLWYGGGGEGVEPGDVSSTDLRAPNPVLAPHQNEAIKDYFGAGDNAEDMGMGTV